MKKNKLFINTLKNIVISLFLILLILTPLKFILAQQSILFFESDSLKYPTKTDFLVKVNISNIDDLYGYTTDIQYNKNLIDYISLEEGDIFKNNGKDTLFQYGVNANDGIIKVASAIVVKQAGINGNGVLFTIKL